MEKLTVAQRQLSALNASVLELDSIQTRIEKYARSDLSLFLRSCQHLSSLRYSSEDRDQKLADCSKITQELEANVSKTAATLEAKRTEMAAREAEVNKGQARRSSLQNNQRLRRLRKRMEETEVELASLPMEEAAESKRSFDVKYEAMQRRERDIKAKVRLANAGVFHSLNLPTPLLDCPTFW